MRKEKSDLTLTEKDKADLLEMGFLEDDFRQIQDATLSKYTSYTLHEKGSKHGKRISCEEAIRLLGRWTWLTGIARSAFHYSACRGPDDGSFFVLFDSSRLFKD